MKFGTYFAYWEQEWTGNYAAYCDRVSRLGFDILEIAAGALPAAADKELADLRRAAKSAGVELTACIGLPAQYDLSAKDEQVRQNGLDFMRKIIIAMEKAGISLIGGIIYAYWPCDFSKPIDKKAARDMSIKSIRELAPFARDHGVALVLETVNRFEHFLINSAAEAVQMVKDIDMDNVKVMLDCFHMNIEEDYLGNAIRDTGKHLGHFHIGECNRKVPGKGHMPWEEMGRALRDIGYAGGVVMEPFVRMGGTVGQDIKVWRDISKGASDAELDRDIADALQFVKAKFL